MNKELLYRGYSAMPSDYQTEGGDLALSLNLLNKNGSVQPICKPKTVFRLIDPDGDTNNSNARVVYVHETKDLLKRFIVVSGSKLYWAEKPSNSELNAELNYICNVAEEPHQIVSIGNVLIALTESNLWYFLWKDGTYKMLGTHMPVCPISFGLKTEIRKQEKDEAGKDYFSVSHDPIDSANIYDEWSDKNKSDITNQVLAKVNKFIADETINKGKFIYPFFIRYAYRLYDGSLTMHSSPILMIANTGTAPWVQVLNERTDNGKRKGFDARIVGTIHSLNMKIENIDAIQDWSDIIKSVDIFISKPIYTYDQNGDCSQFVEVSNREMSYSLGMHTNQNTLDGYYTGYQYNEFFKMFQRTIFDDKTYPFPASVTLKEFVKLPKKKDEDLFNEIKDCSQFYLLHSYETEHLPSERTDIPIKEDYLQSLVVRETMTDDYDSHDGMSAKYAFVYNSRLNLANLTKSLYNGYPGKSLFPYTSGYIDVDSSRPEESDYNNEIEVFYYIKQDGKEIVVKGSLGLYGYNAPFLYLYYPNRNAYKAIIKISPESGQDRYCVVKLEQHSFLNGAFYFRDWEMPKITTNENPIESIDKKIKLQNRLYTSEIGNPFIYPVTSISVIGTGEIYGLATVTKALSEGQFGQFPLYAFTTDGVWAMSVSTTNGAFSTTTPASREVAINTKSIIQLDTAVLFATNRGIMKISGSEINCISEVLNSYDLFSIDELPNSNEIINIYEGKADISNSNIALIPFLDFLKDCYMQYDYMQQRIFVFNNNVSYAYVYSLDSGLWGMMLSDIVAKVNSYPEAYAMTKDGRLVDFSFNGTDKSVGLLITRPIVLDNPDGYKTIDTIIQRGLIDRTSVSQILYGSNDMQHWQIVWSSKDKFLRGFHGSAYKAFRLVVITTLNQKQNITGYSIQYTPKLNNRLR